MNEAQRLELQQLRDEQRALAARVISFETRLEAFERHVETAANPRVPVAPPPTPAAPAPTPEIFAPILPPQGVPSVPPLFTPPAPAAMEMPPPLPPTGPMTAAAKAPDVSPFTQTVPVAVAPPLPAAPRESLEVRIGTTWLVRVGVVLMLTSLAFLGSYLYKNVIPHLGPAGKVGCLYLGAGALTAFGVWLERGKEAARSPKLLNYARVVLAGGLAAIYYVTYAAHWNPQLRVLSDPVLAGALLLGWTAFMVWLADRRGSELLATFAVLLAYYTSAINEVEIFTLFSNLSLTVAAVFLVRRHLWKVFPFASLLATYGSYTFWNVYHFLIRTAAETRAAHHVAAGTGGFWIEGAFLLLYWVLFTGTVFAPGERVWSAVRRAGFVTLNNTAFFFLVTWLLAGQYPDEFWKWSLGFGAVLCLLAETCRLLPQRLDRDTEGAYQLQGALLVAVGFIAYFDGWQLSLVLAVQSVVLLGAALRREGRILLGMAALTASLAFPGATHPLGTPGSSAMWLYGTGVAILLVFNAWWSQWRLDRQLPPPPAEATPAAAHIRSFRGFLSAAPWYFSALGLAVGLLLIEQKLPHDVAQGPVLAVLALLLSGSVYGLRVRAIPFYAQAYLLDAHWHWIENYGFHQGTLGASPGWSLALLLGITLALGHWWQRRWPVLDNRSLPSRQPNAPVAAWQAILVVLLLYAWLLPVPAERNDVWVALSAAVSLGLLAYGVLTRYRALALAGQAFLVFSLLNCLNLWLHPWPGGYGREMLLTLVPFATILATLVVMRRFLTGESAGRLRAGPTLLGLYEVTATLFLLAWGLRYIEPTQRFAFFCMAGALLFICACLRGEARWRWWSAALTLTGVLAFCWLGRAERASAVHLLGIASLAGQQQFARYWLKRQPSLSSLTPHVQGAWITMATLCAWAMLTARMAGWSQGAFTLAAAWSLFAALVFGTGLLLHEKVYRWLGLGILICTLGRVGVVDIWQLDSLGRTISLFVLSLVLMGIGFLYNRFHARWHGLF